MVSPLIKSVFAHQPAVPLGMRGGISIVSLETDLQNGEHMPIHYLQHLGMYSTYMYNLSNASMF